MGKSKKRKVILPQRPFVFRGFWSIVHRVVLPSATLLGVIYLFFRATDLSLYPSYWSEIALFLLVFGGLPILLISLVNSYATGKAWNFSLTANPKYAFLPLLAGRIYFITLLWVYYIFIATYHKEEGSFASLEGVYVPVMVFMPVFLAFITFFSGNSIFEKNFGNNTRQEKAKRFCLWLLFELPEQIVKGTMILIGFLSMIYLLTGLLLQSFFSVDILSYQYSGLLIFPGAYLLFDLVNNLPSVWQKEQDKKESREEWIERSPIKNRVNS